MQDFEDCKMSWLVSIGRDCLNRANLNELWRYRRKLLRPVQGDLPMLTTYLRPDHPLVSHADLDTYFQAIRFALKAMYDEGEIRGAILTDEIHLESLYPVPLVTPHAHILLLSAHPITQAHLDHFKTLMLQFRGQFRDAASHTTDDPAWARYRRKVALFKTGIVKTKTRKPPMAMVTDPRLKVELPISLDLKPIPTQDDFAAVLGYPAKPIALASAYRKTRAILIRENPQDLDLLAQNIDEFFVGSDLLLAKRRSPAYFGACDARRKRGTPYIGAPGGLLRDGDHRDETKALLAKLNAETKVTAATQNSI